MIVLLVFESAIVAGLSAGAGAEEVVCVFETVVRILSRNSAICCWNALAEIKCYMSRYLQLTVDSVKALYRFSMPEAKVFSSGTTRHGTVPYT